MVEKTYLIVREYEPGVTPPGTGNVVDMTVIIDDVSLEKAVEAAELEEERLHKQYPTGRYEINQVYSNVFPEPEYLGKRKLSEIREVSASVILLENAVPVQR